MTGTVDVWCRWKLLNGFSNINVNFLACVRAKGSEIFRIDNGVREGCFMSPWVSKCK